MFDRYFLELFSKTKVSYDCTCEAFHKLKRLKTRGLVEYNEEIGDYQLTKKGRKLLAFYYKHRQAEYQKALN